MNDRDLAAESGQLRRILDAVPSGVLAYDTEGTVVFGNRAVEDLFGYTHGEVVGLRVDLLLPEVLRGRTDTRAVRRDGSEFPVILALNPLHDEAGRLVVASVMDVTERRRAHETLQKAYDSLKARSEEIEHFVYTVSHDLRAPVVTGLSLLELLKQDLFEILEASTLTTPPPGVAEEAVDFVNRLERSQRRMHRLIEDLLELSRVGGMELKMESVAMADVLHTVREDLAEAINRGPALLELPESLPVIVADRARCVQVFENLVGNALKYGADGDNPTVRIFWHETPLEWIFCVKDHGPGIAPEYHERIFHLFQRLQTDKDGTGVGLAIVARIMELHGGRVWVESVPGDGAAFSVAFPKRPTAAVFGPRPSLARTARP